MKDNLINIFSIAGTLADFVELGLADDPARSETAKATAGALKKLIDNFDVSALEAPQKIYIKPKQSNIAKAVAWEHPSLPNGLELNAHLKILDVKFGFTNNRRWVKTTCVQCDGYGNYDANNVTTKIVIWGEFKSQKSSLMGETAEIGEVVATKYKIKSAVEAGGKFNKNFHEVTATVQDKKDLMPNKKG